MFITENVVQVNLTPENDHERKFVQMLMDYEGPVKIHHGVNISECRGGYLRDFGLREALAITIHRPKESFEEPGRP